MRAGRCLRVASPRIGPSSSLLPTRVCDPASLNPREIVDASFLSVRAGNGVWSSLLAPLDASTRVRVPALVQPEFCSLELELTSFSISSCDIMLLNTSNYSIGHSTT
ncbi:hypothetical protein DY000_02015219 [Brassica cretica]|uniref:Uncharacterized protein n=1 Tax=Brassica cretica TaxID=69181 RepID=A0ABQ7D1X4_BRACR|nr:hypothetical protein DY000_02015219 [Brassica cretica]